VEFVETDLAGVAHFSNFFRWMEEAECGFFRALGLSIHAAAQPGRAAVGWPRRHVACEYKAPLRFEDEFEIQLLVREKRRTSIGYTLIFRKLGGAAPLEVARGSATAVCVTMDPASGAMKALPIPEEVATRIAVAPEELLR
ncbi:MAG: acyl-CoA thioesterase, partial [Planctomycetes bacterium]|nr:acyl-CoA thioesterase [Planctomycetota bacterium]